MPCYFDYTAGMEQSIPGLFLLRHGAKPDTLISHWGRTSLHVAAAYYACEALCGANPVLPYELPIKRSN